MGIYTDNSQVMNTVQKIPTKLKDEIANILYDKDLPFNKKRIEIKKLKRKGLDGRSVKIFLRLIEYMSEV